MPALSHKMRHAPLTTPRPWLLLWLVPWLFFSMASGALHDHDWPGGALHKEQPHATQSATAARNDNRLQANLHTAHVSAAHHDCLACHWSAQSAQLLNISHSLDRTVLQALPVLPQAFTAPLSLALPALRGRGPPFI